MSSPIQAPAGAAALLRACALLRPGFFRRSHPATAVYDVSTDPKEKLFWAYKCWVRQVETAEEGSGLEAYFRRQDLRFPLPEGFLPRQRVSVAMGGDLMAVDCITPQSTPRLFDGIRDFYLDADVTTANLESSVYGGAPAGRCAPSPPADGKKRALSSRGPSRMNTSPEMLDRFWEGGRGINYFSTANNHCWDFGEEGLRATLDQLDARGCWHSGTNRTPEEQGRAAIFEKNGIRFAMLSFTCDLNGHACGKPWRVNEVRFNDLICDLSLAERQIADARARGADLVMVHAHWGWEFEMYPHKNVVETAHRLAEMGVDVIVGTHPHVAQPMEKYAYERDGEARQCLILYSLGDFVSFHPTSTDSHLTYVARFDAVKGEQDGREVTRVTDLRVLPVYILAGGREEFRLVRFREVCADAAGAGALPLTERERKDLPHLRQVWEHILLPERRDGLTAE